MAHRIPDFVTQWEHDDGLFRLAMDDGSSGGVFVTLSSGERGPHFGCTTLLLEKVKELHEALGQMLEAWEEE